MKGESFFVRCGTEITISKKEEKKLGQIGTIWNTDL